MADADIESLFVDWNALAVYVAVRVFRYMMILLAGLFGSLGLLLGGLKWSNPTLGMQSQTTGGEMIQQSLPSVAALLLIGLGLVALCWLMIRCWRVSTSD